MVPRAGHHLVVAPHPDDEVLTVGGLIQRVEEAGGWVEVVAVTDGGSAYPEHYDHDELAGVRRREQIAALDELGVSADRVVSIGLRDGAVAEHHDDLVATLRAMSTPDTTIVAPWVHDVHSDHEAVGRAALAAADDVGCALWFSLFWAWHRCERSDLADVEMLRVDLDERTMERKSRALRHHVSQLVAGRTDPMLHTGNLAPSTWDAEFFVMPARGGTRE